MEKFKKSIVNFVLVLLLVVLCGCGSKIDLSYLKTANYDLDLVALNNDEEMFNNFVKIYNNIKKLYGYSISLQGYYSYTYENDTRYDFIVVGTLDDQTYYIEIDYDGVKPNMDDKIEVTGLIDYYYENGIKYDRINVFNLNVLEE